MHIYLLRDIEEKESERMRALLPGLRAVTGQLDYILRGDVPGQQALAYMIAEHQHMIGFLTPSRACAPGGSVERLIKDFNRLIGKEKVLAAVAADVWEQAVSVLCAEGAAPHAAGPLTLAHIHIKGFPAPGGGAVQDILTEQDILSRG